MKFDVEIKNNVSAYLQRLVAEGRNLTPLMRMLAGTMETETERNFDAQGRPRWLGLSRATLEARVNRAAKKLGKRGYRKDGRISKSAAVSAKILQDTGNLAGSINTAYGRDFAVIGSNLPYAAIHQLGGEAGRGKKVRIPARPYLPATAEGALQPEAETAMLRDIDRWLQNLIDA